MLVKVIYGFDGSPNSHQTAGLSKLQGCNEINNVLNLKKQTLATCVF